MFDKAKRQLRIQVDCIFLLRPGADQWDYYTDRDIENGWIVFSEVDAVKMQPENIAPNDFINGISVEQDAGSDGRYRSTVSIDDIDLKGVRKEVIILVRSLEAHLEDAKSLPPTLD